MELDKNQTQWWRSFCESFIKSHEIPGELLQWQEMGDMWIEDVDARHNNSFIETKVIPLRKKATIHQVTTMLATFKNVLFPGHNHLLTTATDDPSL